MNPAARRVAVIAVLLLSFAAAGRAAILGTLIELATPQQSPQAPDFRAPLSDICYNSVDECFAVISYRQSDNPLNPAWALFLQRVDAASGAVIDASPVYSGHSGIHPVIAHAPTANRYMVAWVEAPGTINGDDVGVMFLEHDLQNAWGGTGTYTYAAANGAKSTAPALCFNGTDFVLAYEYDDTLGQHLEINCYSTDGFVSAYVHDVDASDGDSRRPALAWLGGAADIGLVTWAENATATQPRSIRGRTVSKVGAGHVVTLGIVQAISSATDANNNNDWPCLAANATGQRFLVAWEKNDHVNSAAGQGVASSTIAFRMMDAEGVPVDAAETKIKNSATVVEVAPAAAWIAEDNQFMVHWQEGAAPGSEIHGARLNASTGASLEVDFIVAAGGTGRQFPSLAARSGHAEALGAWMQSDGGAIGHEAGRFSTAMTPPPPSPEPSVPPTTTVSDGGNGGGGGGGGGCSAFALSGSAGAALLAFAVAAATLRRA